MREVSLFITCLSDALAPQVGESLIRVLNRLGVRVAFRDAQTCCGQPAYNSGYRRDAAEAAKAFLGVYADAPAIVVPSGSCAAMIRREYPRLLEGEPRWKDRAEAVAKQTYEFSEYLDRFTSGELGRLSRRVGYHTSCHMRRGLGVTEAPFRVLSRVQDLEVVPYGFADECCGFGGTFAVKMGALSAAIGSAKLDYVSDSGAEELVSGDMGCLMHLSGRAEWEGRTLPMRHIAQLIDEATAG